MRDLGTVTSGFKCDVTDFRASRHPVTNDYIPEQLRGEVFLKPDGDMSDKMWDEAALRKWEVDENGGERWEGRERVLELMQDNELERCKMVVDDESNKIRIT